MPVFAAMATRTIDTDVYNLANLAKGGSFGSVPRVTFLIRNIGSDDASILFSNDGDPMNVASGSLTLAQGEFIVLPVPSGVSAFITAKTSSTDIELVCLH